jgi:DNA-binding MarR family transcriptional regulator
MSTLFTTQPPEIRQNLPLAQLIVNAEQWVNISIVQLMAGRGHTELSPAHLAFIANLDCGSTHASEVARRMGVSRQAVYRTTRELQALGVLQLEDDPERRNQKVIRMTPHGIQVVNDARACNAEVEHALKRRLGARDYDRLVSILRKPWGDPAGE